MYGNIKTVCIAGKNQCSIDALAYLIKKFKNLRILALPNKSDDGIDGWQKSFKKFATKKKIKITTIEELYKIENLYLFSLEYEGLLNINNFKSNKLFNFHFSLLPKYRGCHTNFYQILNGEKISGVTLHIIDNGIDSGNIIDKIKFKIPINRTAFENYKVLLDKSVRLFKKNFLKIIKDKYTSKKQNLKKGSYYSRKSVNYEKLIMFKKIEQNIKTHNKLRSLIFQPFQLPIYNGNKIVRSKYKNKQIKLEYLK
jgi:methionyl-tRNA formyltransferase